MICPACGVIGEPVEKDHKFGSRITCPICGWTGYPTQAAERPRPTLDDDDNEAPWRSTDPDDWKRT